MVTAFFPIGREQWSGYSRSDQKYFAYFKHWAAIHNDLIVYTTESHADMVRKIRQELGRENTVVRTVNEIASIDTEIYDLMHKVGRQYPPFSLFPKKPEVSNPDYDFLMYAKFWCLEQASKEAETSKLAWIDFGFDHGGEYYKDTTFFDFEWNYHRPQGKASLFQMRDLPNDPVFDWIRRTESYIHGACFELDTNFASQFHADARLQYEHLLRCGIIDDDQSILLMCHLAKPEDYCCLPLRTWFTMLEQYSDKNPDPGHPRLRPEFFHVKLSMQVKWVAKCLLYAGRQIKHLIRRYAF
nr:WlaTC/HtrL family glycosyltransferase [Bifidobacterium callimiconis]